MILKSSSFYRGVLGWPKLVNLEVCVHEGEQGRGGVTSLEALKMSLCFSLCTPICSLSSNTSKSDQVVLRPLKKSMIFPWLLTILRRLLKPISLLRRQLKVQWVRSRMKFGGRRRQQGWMDLLVWSKSWMDLLVVWSKGWWAMQFASSAFSPSRLSTLQWIEKCDQYMVNVRFPLLEVRLTRTDLAWHTFQRLHWLALTPSPFTWLTIALTSTDQPTFGSEAYTDQADSLTGPMVLPLMTVADVIIEEEEVGPGVNKRPLAKLLLYIHPWEGVYMLYIHPWEGVYIQPSISSTCPFKGGSDFWGDGQLPIRSISGKRISHEIKIFETPHMLNLFSLTSYFINATGIYNLV